MSSATVMLLSAAVMALGIAKIIDGYLLRKFIERVVALESRHSTKGKDVQS